MPLPGVIRLCGAKCRDGHACINPAMANGRCRKHLGKAARGIAAGNFKDGRHSKYMPKSLLERYQQSIDDPDLLNMRHDIALVDARLSQLLQRVDTKQSKNVFEETRKCHDKILRSMTNEDYGGVIVSLGELDRAVGAGLTDYDAWNEVADLIEQRRKLVESEQKRLVAMKQLITTEQAMTFVSALVSVVKQRVTDHRVLYDIQNDLTRLLNIPAQVEEHAQD